MADLSKFRELEAAQQAVVAIAVLIDGNEASDYLQYDKNAGILLSKAAAELAKLPNETRLPYCGTMLREALSKL